jgi:hypothetical protein
LISKELHYSSLEHPLRNQNRGCNIAPKPRKKCRLARGISRFPWSCRFALEKGRLSLQNSACATRLLCEINPLPWSDPVGQLYFDLPTTGVNGAPAR